MDNLLSAPAFAAVLFLVYGLNPREFSLADTPRGPGRLDRMAWSHLGFLYDMGIGLGASSL
eukprot:3497140-Pyramimonas_sp.AAC.1